MLSLRKKYQKEPTLPGLSYFIAKESALVNDPLFSNNAVDNYIKKPVKPARRSLKMNLTGSKEDENQKKKFQMCQKNHDLDACLKYKQFQVNDSKNFLMKSKLCFGCHDVISKELSGRNCQKKEESAAFARATSH